MFTPDLEWPIDFVYLHSKPLWPFVILYLCNAYQTPICPAEGWVAWAWSYVPPILPQEDYEDFYDENLCGVPSSQVSGIFLHASFATDNHANMIGKLFRVSHNSLFKIRHLSLLDSTSTRALLLSKQLWLCIIRLFTARRSLSFDQF